MTTVLTEDQGPHTTVTVRWVPAGGYQSTKNYIKPVNAEVRIDTPADKALRVALTDLAEGRYTRHLTSEDFLASLGLTED